jgi:hypothetical protein
MRVRSSWTIGRSATRLWSPATTPCPPLNVCTRWSVVVCKYIAKTAFFERRKVKHGALSATLPSSGVGGIVSFHLPCPSPEATHAAAECQIAQASIRLRQGGAANVAKSRPGLRSPDCESSDGESTPPNIEKQATTMTSASPLTSIFFFDRDA